MKYTREEIDELLNHPIGKLYGSDYVWRKNAEEVIGQLTAQNERFRTALELIRDNGGKPFNDLSDDEGIGGSCNGSWCAEQANQVLKESE